MNAHEYDGDSSSEEEDDDDDDEDEEISSKVVSIRQELELQTSGAMNVNAGK